MMLWRPPFVGRQAFQTISSAGRNFMKVSVQLFAVAKQRANRGTIEVELSPQGTVADLRAALLAEVPALRGLAGQLRFAVNEEYAPDHARIPQGSRLACIPPVSGGGKKTG